eukprot:TRINITY_DN82739_c0_g1_i1.p1 TRINITY_DN82739_c0_g1~~TRINITY_DN82739_c0_g1_i1.p1  ORF type:complete len:225 (+),score=45.52 TRINITY_DN82739_c0_g1_i1:72-746(+)
MRGMLHFFVVNSLVFYSSELAAAQPVVQDVTSNEAEAMMDVSAAMLAENDVCPEGVVPCSLDLRQLRAKQKHLGASDDDTLGVPMCLDIWAGDEYKDASKVSLWGCNSAANQQWEMIGEQIQNPTSGKCLDIWAGGEYADGTKVDLWECNGAPNQKWMLSDGQLINPASGKCLDIWKADYTNLDVASTSPAAKVELWTCNGYDNQKWKLQDGQIMNDPQGNSPP